MTHHNEKKMKAVVHCFGECPTGTDLGGCKDGCLRCGKCIDACEIGAIYFPEDRRAAKVRYTVCTGCGKCVGECPQKLISLKPKKNKIKMLCNNHDPGKIAKELCKTSCIGCGICAKNCPVGAIRMDKNRAIVSAGKCISCGMCAIKCPRKVIRDVNGILTSW